MGVSRLIKSNRAQGVAAGFSKEIGLGVRLRIKNNKKWKRRRWSRSSSTWLDVEARALARATQTTSVAVMAPALTEGGPQKPENLIPTAQALPAATPGFLTKVNANKVRLINNSSKVCQNREVLAQFVVSANVQPSKIDEQCLQGIPKDLINDVINLKFGSGLDNLSDLIACGNHRKETTTTTTTIITSDCDDTAIMNDPSMGDPTDSMCFFKTIMSPGEADDLVDDIAKVQNDETSEDKENEDDRSLEQIMGFATDMGVQTADIGQNVEEILQVIKSMENAEEAAESIGNNNRLTGGCNETSSQSTVEGVSEIFPDGENFPLNLLNEMDMMGLCNDNITDSVVVDQTSQQYQQQHQQIQQPTKQTELAQNQAQVERRQHELERRAAFLLRRLRKLQSRIVGEHSSEEATHVLELAQKSAKKCFYQDLASLGPKAGNTRNFPELAGSLSSFLQKVQKNCNAQSNSLAVRHRNSSRYFGAGSKDNYINPSANRIPVFGVPQIKLDGDAIEKVAGPLASNLRMLQGYNDSDCTDSSSGGDSCDEMQSYTNPHQQQLPITKRAGWRFAHERANIASRWTWLQAQISDLEYKIRQHNELQRQIRTSKGLVMLEAAATTTTTPGQLTDTSSSSAVNGYSGILPGSSVVNRNCNSPDGTTSTAGTTGFGASRTRPFIRPMYRKRKLVQLDGLHEVSKKAAKPPTVKCNCDGTLAPCAVCTGRKEVVVTQTALELMSVQERIAMVDPGYHPVLSLPDEISHTVHMDAIMRSSDWQQKMMRGSLRITKIKDKDSNERRNNKKVSPEHRTKYPARLKKSQTTLISARIKRKVLKGKRSRSSSERTNHGLSRKRNAKTTPQSQSQQGSSLDEEDEASALSCSSKYSSPVPSPLQSSTSNIATNLNPANLVTANVANLPSSTGTPNTFTQPEKNTLKEKSSNSHSHSRIRQNSYDIDNIVIPYSVAASTRLEKLPYKEIQIPKWRLCDDPTNSDVKNGAVQKSSIDNDVEDVSDETIALRHERSEKEENKRFMTFINLPHHSRIRHSRRTDSRTDSGANTPDPMSPHPSDFGGDTMSPITSPPATPSNVQDTEHTESHHRSSSLHNALRRRTISTTRSITVKDEQPISTSIIEEEHEQVLPYEPRTFPLTDEDYDKMLEVMPGGHLQSALMSVCPQEDKIDDAELDSQESDSTESALCDMEGEDPNDPEWTVAEARETEKERIRPTAKR